MHQTTPTKKKKIPFLRGYFIRSPIARFSQNTSRSFLKLNGFKLFINVLRILPFKTTLAFTED